MLVVINTLRLRQDGRHFANDIFKCIFLNENAWISIKISLKFVPKGPINKIPALVQMMAWRRSGDKPLSGQWWSVYWRTYVSLGLNELSKIIKLQMINSLWPSDVLIIGNVCQTDEICGNLAWTLTKMGSVILLQLGNELYTNVFMTLISLPLSLVDFTVQFFVVLVIMVICYNQQLIRLDSRRFRLPIMIIS